MNDQTKMPASLVDVPALGISFQHQLDDYRSVVFQAHVERDCDEGLLNTVLDKLRRASDRQKAASALPSFRVILANKEAGLKQETATLLQLETEHQMQSDRWTAQWNESGRRGAVRQLPAQKQEADRMAQAIGASRQKITILTKEIADTKAQIAEYEAKLGA